MSSHAQLPPRCPLQKKNVANISVSPTSVKEQHSHLKSLTQSSILEEQLPWLTDLLSDSDSSSNCTSLCRTASDSSTILDGLDQLNEKETEESCDEEDDGMGSTCMYGPNSPRRKNKTPGFPKDDIVSAFSEYVMQNPLHYLNEHNSGVRDSAIQTVSEIKSVKRYPGQRSRARKLQYIAVLEKTVDVLQNFGSKLGIKVDSLVQRHAALSMENKMLKQHLLRTEQENTLAYGEYESLKQEVERLRTILHVTTNKTHQVQRPATNIDPSDAVWNALDMRRLDLN